MKANEISLKDLLWQEPHRLEVPFFQRRYVWQEENWQELVDTIDKMEQEKVFWGSIIIKVVLLLQDGNSKTKGYIIDGQQRLTTISLLTKAIYDLLTDDGKEDAIDILKKYVFFPKQSTGKFSEENYDIIISHSRYDKEDYEEIIRAGVFTDKPVEIPDSPQISQIKRCYAYFRKAYGAYGDEKLKEVLDKLYSEEKVFVSILLGENDINEQLIFDTINRAGQKLDTSDIIKNNLFKRMVDGGMDIQTVSEICDKNWDGIFWNHGDKLCFWDEKRQFGNVSKSHLDFLLYCVACIEWSDEDVKTINDKLDCIYEKKTSGYTNEQLVELSERIAKYALLYQTYIYDFGNELEHKTFSKTEHVNRLLLLMNKWKIQMFYPYVLKRLYDNMQQCNINNKTISVALDNDQMNRDFRLLEAFLLRNGAAGMGTSSYSKQCSELLQIGMETFISNISVQHLNDENERIKGHLKSVTNSNIARMILFYLELTKWNAKDDFGTLPYNYQIEHIMPQRWQEYWPLELNGNKEEDMEKIANRNAAIKAIGNQLLLSELLNNKIRNREFQVKMNGEDVQGKGQRREGYRDRTQLKLTKELIDAYKNGDQVWDEEHIYKRTNSIATQLIALWDYSSIMNNSL